MPHHYFPQEILVEILISLPVKSLCRFTIVCKSWHALITSRSFISRQLHHALNSTANHQQGTENKSFILGGGKSCCVFLGEKNTKLKFPFDGCFRIVGSSNGLLCLASELPDRLPLRDPDDSEKVILWNPSIYRSLVLPQPTIERPSSPHIVFGFGNKLRDAEDYIVVRIVYHGYLHANSHSPEVEVYSLKTHLWKKVVQPDIRCRIMPSCNSPVLVNGRLHWLASRRVPGFCLPQPLILAFDLTDEVFSQVTVPYEFDIGDEVTLCYNLSAEALTVIETRGSVCRIWAMKDYGVAESWTVRYSFDLVQRMDSVVMVLGDGQLLIRKLNNELVSYDIKTSTMEDIGVFMQAPSFDVHSYVESLVLLQE